MAVERIRKAISTSELSQAEIARRVTDMLGRSIDRSMINKIAKDKRDVSADEADALEQILSIKAEPRRVSAEEEWQEEELERAHRAAEPAFSFETWTPKVKGAVPELDGRLGAGEGEEGEILQLNLGGTAISGHRIVDEWLFPEKVLRAEMGASISKTVVMLVKGDSMEPNYRPGDRVLVDLTQKTHDEDTVYVISDGESAPRIKRLVTVFNSKPRKLLVVSDNPAIADQELLATDITIIGRVVGVVSRR